MKNPKTGAVISLTCLFMIGGLAALPILAVGLDEPTPVGCPQPGLTGEAVDDGTPSILGSSTLTVANLRTWWASTGRGQPARLRIAIADLIALYISEGESEGVRGDRALAQAVLETGHFTNSDTAINNFAGIAHYDGTPSGSGFKDPMIGVRAQIQLLKKYALGNNAPLANPDVAPNAGASATTWGGLAGTWASATNYWTSLSTVYESMRAHAVANSEQASSADSDSPAICSTGDPLVSGDYALPLEGHWYEEHPEWFDRPHHDYPAIDIPVPIGTPIYAVADGVVVGTPTSGKCGIGVVLNGGDQAQYTYCHGQPGTQAVAIGDHVTVGQHILDSASSGNSTGPHLHFSIEVGGVKRCPQPFLAAIALEEGLAPRVLPATGCTS